MTILISVFVPLNKNLNTVLFARKNNVEKLAE